MGRFTYTTVWLHVTILLLLFSVTSYLNLAKRKLIINFKSQLVTIAFPISFYTKMVFLMPGLFLIEQPCPSEFIAWKAFIKNSKCTIMSLTTVQNLTYTPYLLELYIFSPVNQTFFHKAEEKPVWIFLCQPGTGK